MKPLTLFLVLEQLLVAVLVHARDHQLECMLHRGHPADGRHGVIVSAGTRQSQLHGIQLAGSLRERATDMHSRPPRTAPERTR